MIGLDTNVVVRFLVQDDEEQSALATSLFTSLTAKDRGYLSTVVLVEVFWVLRRGYRIPSNDIAETLLALVSADEIRVDEDEIVRAALRQARGGADFADALVALDGLRRGCEYTATFDKRASELTGMRLLEN